MNNNIEVPVYKQKLKNVILEKKTKKLEKKLNTYKYFSIAASILFLFSITIFVLTIGSSQENFFLKNQVKKYTAQLNYQTKFNDKLEEIMINESMKEGQKVYPVNIKNKSVKIIKLNNGKTVRIEKKLDVDNYATAY